MRRNEKERVEKGDGRLEGKKRVEEEARYRKRARAEEERSGKGGDNLTFGSF